MSTQQFNSPRVEFGQLDGGGVASGSLHDLIPCITWTCIAVGIDGLFMIWFDYRFYGTILSNALSVAGSCSVHEMTSVWILTEVNG